MRPSSTEIVIRMKRLNIDRILPSRVSQKRDNEAEDPQSTSTQPAPSNSSPIMSSTSQPHFYDSISLQSSTENENRDSMIGLTTDHMHIDISEVLISILICMCVVLCCVVLCCVVLCCVVLCCVVLCCVVLCCVVLCCVVLCVLFVFTFIEIYNIVFHCYFLVIET
jgi:Flp pilus assembly protein TadB